MKGTAALHLIPSHVEVPGEMNIAGSCVSGGAGGSSAAGGTGGPLDGSDSGALECFLDPAFAAGVGGIWIGREFVQTRKHVAGKVHVSMFVKVGFDMVQFQRMGRDSQHQSDENGSILKTWVTDLQRDVVMSHKSPELTWRSQTLTLMIGMPNVLRQILWGRKLNSFQSSFS